MPHSVSARIFRYDPTTDSKPRYVTYKVEVNAPISAMTLVQRIHDLDPSLACRTPQCYKGVCGSCSLRLNGRNVKACTVLVRPGEEVTLEPHSGYRLIRDLAVDFTRRKGSEGHSRATES
jgi:succinate dehydrogenase / fumarate reductase iron-sulfur subunit